MQKNRIVALVGIVLIVGGVLCAWLYTKNKSVDNQVADSEETAYWETYRNEKYGFEFKYPADSKIEITADNIEALVLHVSPLQNVNPNTIPTSFQFLLRDKGNFCVRSTDKKVSLNNIEYSTHEGFVFGVLVGDETPHYSKSFVREHKDKCLVAVIDAWWSEEDIKSTARPADVKIFDPNFDPNIETKTGIKILESIKFTK